MLNDKPAIENYTETEIKEYLRRLGIYASDRLTRMDIKQLRAVAEPVRFITRGREITIDVPKLLSASSNLQDILRAETDVGDIARATIPLECIVPRPKRENIMRAVAGPLSAYGVTMAHRWATNEAPRQWIDWLVDQTLAALLDDRDAFSHFIRSCVTFKWMIVADFCIADKTKKNDVFAFTVYPVDDEIENLIARAQRSISRDYKEIRESTADAIGYLSSRRRFTFAMIPTRDRKVIPDVASARTTIDNTIASVQARRDAYRFEEEVKHWKAIRQEARSNSFPFRLLENTMLTAAFAGTIAMLLAGEGRAETVAFIPDRDKMTDAFNGAMLGAFATNAWSFTMRRRYPPLQVALGTAGVVSAGQSAWFDPLMRIPDHIAGLLSGINFGGGETQFSRPTRDYPLLREVLSGNPNIVVIQYPQMSVQSLTSQRAIFSRRPTTAR